VATQAQVKAMVTQAWLRGLSMETMVREEPLVMSIVALRTTPPSLVYFSHIFTPKVLFGYKV
jgi:hypothetical protein